MAQSVIQGRSFDFAVRIVKLARYLRHERKEFELSSQLLRAGTSIGANINEALGGCSRKDFAFRMSIAAKEARETEVLAAAIGGIGDLFAFAACAVAFRMRPDYQDVVQYRDDHTARGQETTIAGVGMSGRQRNRCCSARRSVTQAFQLMTQHSTLITHNS